MRRHGGKSRLIGLVLAGASILLGAGYIAAQQASHGAKLAHAAQQHNMQLVGSNDLQARSAYQPIIQKQGNKSILYVGHHGGAATNPLTGQEEPNGTSIVDVTNPSKPIYLHHLPGGSGVGEAGGAQMVRACNGSDLPRGDPSKVYLLRATSSAHEVYDVTNPASPQLVTTVVGNLQNTHKNFWECETGIAYLVSDGRTLSSATPSFPNWRTSRMTQIFDLSDPANPVFIRNYGLVGQEPGSTGPVPTGVHGMISLGDRVYAGHGTGSNGILQIIDRTTLLDPSTFNPTNPTPEQLLAPQLGRLDTPPTMGAHTVFPVIGQPVPEFARSTRGNVRDFVFLVNEAGGGHECRENRQLVYMVEITTPSTPMGVDSFQVRDESGDFCRRGGRFGAHASHESFTPLFYGKLMFVSWFNAGVRAIDIREPFHLREAAYYIPATTSNTDVRCIDNDDPATCKVVIQTNNVEVDDRGLIYLVDRANTGVHIVRLTGDAKKIVEE